MGNKSGKPSTLQLLQSLESIPTGIVWQLSPLDVFKGKQELYQKQSPQKLKTLKEHALIESSISSNRMEGVNIARSRIETVVFGNSLLRDRDEEEVRGYQQALRWVHEENSKISLSIETILKLHKLCKGDVWDAGKFKEKQVDITEKLPTGEERVRFHPPGPKDTDILLQNLITSWEEMTKERRIHPLILLSAFNLDFLCIHPFRDGNGRVSRILLLLQLYHLGFHIGRYISIEKHIEINKQRYYDTLEESSQHWHSSKNDPWPFAIRVEVEMLAGKVSFPVKNPARLKLLSFPSLQREDKHILSVVDIGPFKFRTQYVHNTFIILIFKERIRMRNRLQNGGLSLHE